MADGRGGYRRPTNPAPASGPGALSRRTDGRQPMRDLPDAKYGEQAAFQAAQGAAPMAESSVNGGGGIMPLPDLSGITPMDAPSQRPDEPITAGMPGGEGAGPSFAPMQSVLTEEQRARFRSYLPVLIQLASQEDADPHTRQFVRQLRGELG